jgi:hypothetical protein
MKQASDGKPESIGQPSIHGWLPALDILIRQHPSEKEFSGPQKADKM